MVWSDVLIEKRVGLWYCGARIFLVYVFVHSGGNSLLRREMKERY